MSVTFNDSEIDRLVRLKKPLPDNWQSRLRSLRFRQELSQKRATLIVRTGEGDFRIMIRQSTINPLDFSVVLGFKRPRESRWFILRRYNGQHAGEHRNRLEQPPKRKERTGLRGCHIHMATARYQETGF